MSSYYGSIADGKGPTRSRVSGSSGIGGRAGRMSESARGLSGSGGGGANDDEEFQPLLLETAAVAEDGSSANGRAGSPNSQTYRVPLSSSSENEIANVSGSGSGSGRLSRNNGILASSGDSDGEDGGTRADLNAISNCDTIIHLLKGNIGTGILAMPDAIKNSGLLVGNLGLVFMSLICVFSMHMLVDCAHELGARRQRAGGAQGGAGGAQGGSAKLTYPQVAEMALATSGSETLRKRAGWARNIINIFLCITQLGFCCVYFVFCSQNIQLVMDHHFGAWDYHAYMGVLLPFMLLLCSVRNLKYLSPFSMLANILQFVGLALIFFYLLQDLPRTWERPLFASWSNLPLYFGTAIYAFEGIGVVLPLENQMAYPKDLRGWNGVLNTSMVIVSCLYIAVGFFGYLKYGDAVKGSITLNLPVEQWLAQIIILMMSLAIFFSYGLQFYVVMEILTPIVARHCPSRPIIAEYSLRYGMVLVTFGLAAAIPKLDLFISLVGAVSSSTLALLAPAIIDTITYWPHTGRFGYRLWRNFFLFMVGFVGFLTGTYVSMSNIITYFMTGK